MVDINRLNYSLQNIGDIAFKKRVKSVVQGLEIKDQDRILDCGCGEGFCLKVISELCRCQLCGFDRDEEALSRARQELDSSRVQLVQGDIYKLPYHDGEFDKIILSEVLEHLPDDVKALSEVKRVLKPGGILFITVPNSDYPFFWDPINKILETFFHTHIKNGFWAGIWNMHMRLYAKEEIAEVIRRAGLKIVYLQTSTHYCILFNHLFLNGMKRLLNTGMLPKAINNAADKFKYKENKKIWLNPVTLGYTLFNFIDQFNENISSHKSSVSIDIKTINQL
jgi:ubiquinone/menaquinone biosynthesis C-methylase UbiE